MIHRRRKTDANHAQIMGVLRAMGASVEDLSAVGKGCPDLLVGAYGRDVLCEVKDGDKVPSARKLRPSQTEFAATWRGRPVVVLQCNADAIELIRTLRMEAAAGLAVVRIEGEVS